MESGHTFFYLQHQPGCVLSPVLCHVCDGHNAGTCSWAGHTVAANDGKNHFTHVKVPYRVHCSISRLPQALQNHNQQLLNTLPSLAHEQTTVENYTRFIDDWLLKLDPLITETSRQESIGRLYQLQDALTVENENFQQYDEQRQVFILSMVIEALKKKITQELTAQAATPAPAATVKPSDQPSLLARSCSWIQDTALPWLKKAAISCYAMLPAPAPAPAPAPQNESEHMRGILRALDLDNDTITRLQYGASIFDYAQDDVVRVGLAWKNIRSCQPDSLRNLENFIAVLRHNHKHLRERLRLMANFPTENARELAELYIQEALDAQPPAEA